MSGWSQRETFGVSVIMLNHHGCDLCCLVFPMTYILLLFFIFIPLQVCAPPQVALCHLSFCVRACVRLCFSVWLSDGAQN